LRFGSRFRRRCPCRHGRTAHTHHRRGTDCGLCSCPRWGAGPADEQFAGPGDDAGEWVESLRRTGNDGTDDPPDPGMVARAHGWVADAGPG
jgi:hypothetical protein